MFDLGAVVPLSVTVRDPAGQPADAGEVTLTITLPDGAVAAVGPVTSTEPGVYGVDYVTVKAGRHLARWVATGVNASAYVEVFDVAAADPGAFISLADLKRHLNKTGVGDDDELRRFAVAACAMVEDRIGHVTPVTLVHEVRAGRRLVLPQRPVVEVVSVQRLPGLEPVEAVLTSPEGVVELAGGRGMVRVTYRAGRTPIPGNVRMAALELAAHLWRTSQLNSRGGRLPVGEADQYMPGVTFSLPYSVRQLLGLDKRPRDEVLVG
jgi:hypothetical protein